MYAHCPDLDIDGQIKGASVRLGLDQQLGVDTPNSILMLSKATRIEET